MTYKEFIENILSHRGRFACGNEYHERHHVVPKCMGGSNDKDNLIDLYAREHFIAHRLLAMENPDNDKLIYAWWMMSHINDNNQERYEVSPEEYEEARIQFIQSIIGERNPMYGKSRSEDVKQRIRDKLIGVKLSNERRKHMSEAHKGIKFSEEHCEKIGEAVKQRESEKPPFRGKHHSDESKKKIGEANTGSNNHRSFHIYSPELDESFWGLRAVEKKYGIDPTTISRCLKGKQKHAGKHPITGEELTWIKLEDKIS